MEAVHDYKRIAEIIIEQLGLPLPEGGSRMHTEEERQKEAIVSDITHTEDSSASDATSTL